MKYKNLICLLPLMLIVSLLAPGSQASGMQCDPYSAMTWTYHYDASNGYSYAGEGISTITFDDWGCKGPLPGPDGKPVPGRTAKDFAPINGFGPVGQQQHVVTLWPDRLTPDDPQDIKHDVTNTPVYTNANMDSQVNFYFWGYTSPGFDIPSDYSDYKKGIYSASTRTGSIFNMQIDLDGDYFVSKADMHFAYYDTFSYRDTTGVNSPEEVKTSLSFQPYPVSDGIGWCGSVLAKHPDALEAMAGQLTFDIAFDVYGSTGKFMGTQIIPRFEMRDYGTLNVKVWVGSELQKFSSDGVIMNTNPNNKDRFDVDPDYYNRVSFAGGGVLPDGVWVSADSYNTDGSRKLNDNGTWNVTVVPAGTNGAVWHSNAFAGYAFILRADALRMLDWWDVATYGPDLCVGKNCNDGNPCTADSCVGGVCVHKEACDDHNFCTVDTCNMVTGGCTNTPIAGCGCSGQLDGTPCIDGNYCTAGDVCRGGVCAGTPIFGCGSPVSTTGNNFTMDDAAGGAAGGTNDVKFTWDGKVHSDLIGVPNATLSTNEPFQSYLWYAKNIEVVGPGAHRIDMYANSSLANNYFYEVTVPADKIGVHMLFDWGKTTALKSCCKANCDIDVWIVWASNKSYVGNFWAGSDNGVTSTGAPSDLPTTCVPVVPVSVIDGAANTSATVWDLVSIDCEGRVLDPDGNSLLDYPLDGISGLPMGDGPFAGFNANFNVMTGIKPDKCEAGWQTRCNDNNPCTTDTCEKATGKCVNTPKDCNDGNVCTEDACDPATGNCVYTNNALSCDDGNPCTSGDVCSGVVCAGTPIANCPPSPVVDTFLNNFTMLDQGGALAGGANDVHFTWDGTRKTSVAASGQVSNATLSSPCPFDGITWTAHDVAIYGPGSYCVYTDCPAGSPGCGSGVPIVFTVGEGELGAHMLFDWSTTKGIDVVNIWTPKAAFAPSPLMIGGCGSNPAYKVWDWMSKDWNNDGINGAPMVDGPFLGFSANFNVMGIVPSCTPPVNGCEDNNVCTNNDWDATAHGPGECPCINSAVAPGTACNNGQFCNGSDTCVNKSCPHAGDPCAGTPLPFCNETLDRCDQCRTDADCTTDKMCQNNVCVPRNVVCIASNVGAACNDNNACTTNDKCVAKTVGKKTTYSCQGTALNCNDNNACTNDSCNTATGCAHTPKVCNDNNACTTDSCNTATGACVYTPVANGTACTNGTCQNGFCVTTQCPRGSYKKVTLKGTGSYYWWVENQIMTEFTVSGSGCILRYTAGTITATPGTVLKVDWKEGMGPNPTSVTWKGVAISAKTVPYTITCPSSTGTVGNLVLKNTSARGGKDTDTLTVSVAIN